SFFTPMMHATLVVPGGTVDAANPALPLYAGLALTPPDDGAGAYARAGILLETPLADYDVSVGPFATTFEVSALAGWQDMVVWGLANTVTSGTYEKDSVARLVTRAKDALPSADDHVEEERRAVMQAELELMYGAAHPITRAPYLNATHLAAVDVRALTAWHTAHHLPTGARLVITGQFSPGLLTKHMKEAFARWKGGLAPSIPKAAPSETPRRIAVIDEDKTHVTFELRV